jgi:hypothetical protein
MVFYTVKYVEFDPVSMKDITSPKELNNQMFEKRSKKGSITRVKKKYINCNDKFKSDDTVLSTGKDFNP